MAGLFSRLAQSGIKRGKFPREPYHPVYFKRRVYGALWTQVFYFKPVYSVVLAIPVFKTWVMRLFGYENSTDFTVYPDTWIRDLPCLKIGAGAYLSNRATIGTNICLADGHILVDNVRVAEKGLIGHLAMLAPGAKVETGAEIGVGCSIGIRVSVKAGASVKPDCTINHGAVIGEGASIGTKTYLGLKCSIGAGLQIPAGANIPNGAILLTQEDVNRFYSSETKKLEETIDGLAAILGQNSLHAS